VFAWQLSQMLGIPREVIEHHLKIYPDARPVQQKPRKQSIERQNFIREEIKKLLDAGFIREVHHPRWLTNSVVIPKAGVKFWMCIDYTSLNKACPKDPFPLPRIYQIVDSTSGCDLLCFLYAYSSFHQIAMSREDEEHIAFIIVDCLFCYVSMPYGLKNALPTFVRVMHKTFGDLIKDLIEVYIDDIIVKIKSRASLLDNLAQVFEQVVINPYQVEPRQMCVRGHCGQATRFPGFLPGNRGTPRKDQDDRSDVASCPHQGCAEAHRFLGLVEPIYL
jgi:hypothetical protein